MVAKEREHFRGAREAAAALIAVGESEPGVTLDDGELAAWTVAASLLLNLDETMTRQ